MLNLAPWYYRKLLGDNLIIEKPKFYEVQLLNKKKQFEAIVSLRDNLKPSWIGRSEVYTNCDGSGTSDFKNVAVYKAISEALERLAFYELVESEEEEYSFDVNPTTTGMAAFPYFNCVPARSNAINEAVERWAIHELNKNNLPVLTHKCNIDQLTHFEILTPFKKTRVSLLSKRHDDFYVYGFAGGNNLMHSFERALIELDRNIRVISKYSKDIRNRKVDNINDHRILFFSTELGFDHYNEMIRRAPRRIINDNPKVICDKQVNGYWNEYTKVWRYLLENSYCTSYTDHTFFMF